MKNKKKLGKILFDSHPNNPKFILTSFVLIIIGGSLYWWAVYFFDPIIYFLGFLLAVIGTIILIVNEFIGGKFRFKIYQDGLKLDVNKFAEDPRTNLTRGEKIGKRKVRYNEIESIHPYMIKSEVNKDSM